MLWLAIGWLDRLAGLGETAVGDVSALTRRTTSRSLAPEASEAMSAPGFMTVTSPEFTLWMPQAEPGGSTQRSCRLPAVVVHGPSSADPSRRWLARARVGSGARYVGSVGGEVCGE